MVNLLIGNFINMLSFEYVVCVCVKFKCMNLTHDQLDTKQMLLRSYSTF